MELFLKEIETALKDVHQEYDLFQKKHIHLYTRNEVIHLSNAIRSLLIPSLFHENLGMEETFSLLKEMIEKSYAYKGIEKDAKETAKRFMEHLPFIAHLLKTDVEAFYEGDPAAKSKEEIIMAYPGFYAIYIYRIAHVMYDLEIPYLPRILSELAHSSTGIDINPGATIDESFFIDHGTGVVIGETATIGKRVKIYQGVTLGALSTRAGQKLSGVKRHPTIEDDVTIYSGTSILGGDVVIGKGSTIGGNTFVTESIPKHSLVIGKSSTIEVLERKKKRL